MPNQSIQNNIKITPLGGQSDQGDKNMVVVETAETAVVIDTGFQLGTDYPGANFAIPKTDYLRTIQHKLAGYIYTHGHLDHIGAAPYIVGKYPAPIYGSGFTIGKLKSLFDDSQRNAKNFKPTYITLDEDKHEQIQIGSFRLELVRVTHAIPGSTLVVLHTKDGAIINSGDFRLDPEPLDDMPTDIPRLREIGKQGVLVAMCESTYTDREGRTPTESTLVASFEDLFSQAEGRVIVSLIASNINRTQMAINSAIANGRKVILDGRSLLKDCELAIEQGILKVPRGSLISIHQADQYPDDKVAIIATGHQGEPNASLGRMATGAHPHIALKPSDTIILSANPIMGNERAFHRNIDNLNRTQATLYTDKDHELDSYGPLHVSGHAGRPEYQEMLQLLQPQYFLPIYGSYTNRRRYGDLAQEIGIDKTRLILADDGQQVLLDPNNWRYGQKVQAGSIHYDNEGNIMPEQQQPKRPFQKNRRYGRKSRPVARRTSAASKSAPSTSAPVKSAKRRFARSNEAPSTSA